MSGLSNVMPKRGGKERESEPRSRQAIYFGRAEREIMRSGGYSWVGDIRARVALAKNTSRTEGEFRVALAKLGISVEDRKCRCAERPRRPLKALRRAGNMREVQREKPGRFRAEALDPAASQKRGQRGLQEAGRGALVRNGERLYAAR